MPHLERKADFFGGWSAQHFENWNIKTVEDEYDQFVGFCGPCVASADNVHLSGAQKELITWHWKLGIDMRRIQELMRTHALEEPSGITGVMDKVIQPQIPAASSCPIPICQSCLLSKARQRNPKVVKSKALPQREAALTRDQYCTGDFVSMDQYVVKTPGRLPEGYGREGENNRFHGGTIFRDAATKIIHVENQVSLGAGETVLSKIRFEEWLWDQAAAAVSHYHSDNGVFTAELFKEACKDDGQTQSFSGVGAKHQNAEAE